MIYKLGKGACSSLVDGRAGPANMGGSVFTRLSGGYPLSSMVLNQISHSPTFDNDVFS